MYLPGCVRASFSTTHAHTANVLDLAASVASPVAGAPRTAWAPRTARRKNFGPIVIIQSQRSWHGLRRCRRRCCSCMRGQLARTTSYDGLRSAAIFLRRKAPGRHAAMLFDPPEQRCFHRSSNAERAAEQAGHLLQVTQSASSRLSSSAVQAGTTSRTTRAAWTAALAAPTSSRADGNHPVQHGRAATVSAAVGCRSDATACACADGAVQFYASIGARMPTHASPHIAPPQCGAGGAVDAHPMRPFEVMCLVRFVAISRPGLGF